MRALLPLLLLGTSAVAQPVCRAPYAPTAMVLQELEQQFGETPVEIEVQADGSLRQMLASASTGTWTALIVRPDGLACIAGSGQGYVPAATEWPT